MRAATEDNHERKKNGRGSRRLPPWFRIRLTASDRSSDVQRLIRDHHLHTVCRSAACPNRTECWNAGTATFMILGNICTRGCRFCGVPKGTPQGLDAGEPGRVARAIASLKLRYAVVTSVTRDDLPDGGASLFANSISSIRELSTGCKVEVLIPDFQGSASALRTVLDARPDVLSHNIETVPSLYPRVRPQADYQRSLQLLSRAHVYGAITKTGLMLGLGEGIDEVRSVMSDLRAAGCDILTLGQYLPPSHDHLPVITYYEPREFDELRECGISLGFRHVAAGPRVRSSYHAGEFAADVCGF